MSPRCDFCSGDKLREVYVVPGSPKGACVRLCPECALLQSTYAPRPEPREKIRSLSSGPDWGNIRHGKGLRLQANLGFIAAHADPAVWRRVLDVGSNRGHFCRHVLAHWKTEEVVALEPDAEIVEPYRSLPGLTFIGGRFERTNLSGRTFDFIHCSHTLEHAASAAGMLRGMFSLLAPGGCLFVEVPSVLILKDADNLEEFFIDKHTFHFHPATLTAFVQSVGFEVMARQPDVDVSHVTLLLRRPATESTPPFPPVELRGLAVELEASVKAYAATLQSNLDKLGRAREKIDFLLSRQKVAFWGAGRQLDSFMRHTGFDLKRVGALIDEHLHGIVSDVSGMPIQKPDVLRALSPQVVVAFARNAYPEIARKVRSYGVKNVIRFSDLLRG